LRVISTIFQVGLSFLEKNTTFKKQISLIQR